MALELIELSNQESNRKKLPRKCNAGDLCPNCKANSLNILSKHFRNNIKVYLICTLCGSKRNLKILNQNNNNERTTTDNDRVY